MKASARGRTSSREAGYGLLGASLEIPLVPARARSRACRARPLTTRRTPRARYLHGGKRHEEKLARVNFREITSSESRGNFLTRRRKSDGVLGVTESSCTSCLKMLLYFSIISLSVKQMTSWSRGKRSIVSEILLIINNSFLSLLCLTLELPKQSK